jgi:excisionase family DNA binding protein
VKKPKQIDLSTRLALRVAEVAALLGVSSDTVRGMISRGEMPGRKICCDESERLTYIVPVDGLRAWLAGQPQPSPGSGE